MSTPTPSTTPKPQPGRTAHPGAKFAREHGSAARWTPDTCDLYLDLFSAPSPRCTRGATR
ncbi:hypothetical protein ACFW0I_36485 [[Kitasatospora] papulosa]|uniref:hypothetical protein n=1 Tax=[Kitasatospora] papulosa TaxID=1464011 RepID=UPI00368E2BDC